MVKYLNVDKISSYHRLIQEVSIGFARRRHP